MLALAYRLAADQLRERGALTPHGLTWALFSYVPLFLCLNLLFSGRFAQGTVTYPVFVLIGTTMASYFVTTTGRLLPVIHSNRAMLVNSMIPIEAVILAEVGLSLVPLAAGLVLCLVVATAVGDIVWERLLLVPTLSAAFVLLTAGASTTLALLFAIYARTANVWALLSQLLLFSSAVFYSPNVLSPAASWAVRWMNPLTSFIGSFRSIFLARPVEAGEIIYAHCTGIAVALGSAILIRRYGKSALEKAG